MKKSGLWILLATIFLQSFAGMVRADILDNWTVIQPITYSWWANNFYMDGIVYGNGCYVATANYQDGERIYSSSDGMNWVVRRDAGGPFGLNLNYANGRFLGLGGYASVVISADGTNWAVTSLPTVPNPIYVNGYSSFGDITYGNGIYVEVGDISGVGNIYTSTDGTNWTSRTSSPAPGGHISSVAYGANLFVAIGSNDGLEYTAGGSAHGVTVWTRRSIPGGSLISYNNGLFMVSLTAGTNLLSTDGINWTPKYTGLTKLLGRVFYANGLFLAREVSGYYLATSSDGTNWFQYPQHIPGYNSAFISNLATDGTHIATTDSVTLSNNVNGYIYLSDPLASVRMTNTPLPQVALSGLVGRNYQIQSADILTSGPNNWRTNVTLQLTNTPTVWNDATAPNPQRFYRGMLMP